MKNEPLWNKTVDILVKAYLKGVLEYSDPCGCAVGNLIAANNKYTINNGNGVLEGRKNGKVINPIWGLCLQFGAGEEGIYPEIQKQVLKQAISTGYSYSEIAEIEKAFYVGISLTAIDRGSKMKLMFRLKNMTKGIMK